MGIVFRQSVKTFIVTISGAVLGALFMYYSAKYLPNTQAFGFTRNLTYASLVISQFCLFGLNSTLYMFFQRYKDDAPKRRMLLTICFSAPGAITILLTILAYIFKQQLVGLYKDPADAAQVNKYFVWFPVYAFIWCYIVLLESFAYINLKTALSTFTREILLRVLNILLIVLFCFGLLSFSSFVAWSVLVSVVPILFLGVVALRTGKFGFSLDFGVFSKTEYKGIANYAWSHLLASISITLVENLPALLLGIFYKEGLSAIGIYTLAVYISSVSQIPFRAMAQSTTPVLTEAYHAKDMVKVRDLFTRSSINILLVAMVMFNVICLNLNNATAILPSYYSSFAPIAVILVFGRLVDMATGLNGELIAFSEHYKYNFRITLVLPVLLYISCWLFIPRFGLYGAAWGTAGSIIIFNVCKMLFVWWKWKLNPFSKNTLLVLLAGGVSAAAGYFFPHFFNPARHMYVHSAIDVMMRSAVIIIVYVLMILWLQPADDVRTYIASVKKNKRLF